MISSFDPHFMKGAARKKSEAGTFLILGLFAWNTEETYVSLVKY